MILLSVDEIKALFAYTDEIYLKFGASDELTGLNYANEIQQMLEFFGNEENYKQIIPDLEKIEYLPNKDILFFRQVVEIPILREDAKHCREFFSDEGIKNNTFVSICLQPRTEKFRVLHGNASTGYHPGTAFKSNPQIFITLHATAEIYNQ